MDNMIRAFDFLRAELEKRSVREILDWEDYLELVRQEPRRVLRNIFQLFYDMVKFYVKEGKDDYPNDPESIGFKKYDCSKLLAEGADNPFFADTLFANRLMRQVESLRYGFQQNRIYVYDGPSGCGKSTFLNNLLASFEAYTNTKEGQSFEIVWEIDEGLFLKDSDSKNKNKKFIVPCPSHDYPILIIPREYRLGFLDRLWSKGIPEILKTKDYDWLLKGESCTICKSIFDSSLEKLGSLDKVLSMVKAVTYKFDRRKGEGISVFNPGDRPIWGMPKGGPGTGPGSFSVDQEIQKRLDSIFGTKAVKYVYSPLAKTNNGIYVLMDIKLHNRERLQELHNVISEEVHKVGDIEEKINSLFFALMNPEDKKILKDMASFQGRIYANKIPFVLEPATEAKIYRSICGEQIDSHFLPRIVENFARVIISSRMTLTCEPLQEWIGDISKYQKYCDEYGLLLRMAIYGDIIPSWLSEEDRKNFTAPVRWALISWGEKEGESGFSGRESLRLFDDFFNRYSGKTRLINISDVMDFFKHRIPRETRNKKIPKNFLKSLEDSYDYTVLNEIKTALYFYNEAQISEDILHFIWATNYNIGEKTRCRWTGKEFEITMEFLKEIAQLITGISYKDSEIEEYIGEIQQKYTLIVGEGQEKEMRKTELYKQLFDSYTNNLKEKVFEPYKNNRNFLETVKTYGTEDFEASESRLKTAVDYMIKNLIEKFGYTEQGAKEIVLYAFNKDLASKFE